MKPFFPFFRIKTLLAASALLLSLQPIAHAAETAPAEVHLDYAYYSPVSLVLKHFGFLEKPYHTPKSVGCSAKAATVHWNTSTVAASISLPAPASPLC